MGAIHIQPGDVMDYTAVAAVAAGEVVVVGTRIGVALTSIAAGKTGSVQVKQVFRLAKNSADTIAQGAVVYWDATNKRITSTASGNTQAGHAFYAAGAGATVIDVDLNC